VRDLNDLMEELSTRFSDRGVTLGVAESLTGGLVCDAFAVAPGSGEWFHGGLVAYSAATKHGVLDVPEGPVVSQQAAEAMGRGIAGLLRTDYGVGVTGVGGPDAQDGEPPGTVWIAVHGPEGTSAQRYHFDGDPGDVCNQAYDASVRGLAERLGLDT
jgi:nicotinamide-nucleotide amidase